MVYLLLKNIHKVILFISSLLLVACSSSPVSMQLQPELSSLQTASPLTNKIVWEISSQDRRIEQYLIEVTKGRNAATLINESQSSRLIIENALQQQWSKHGLRFSADSTDKINIQLIKLLAKVKQNTLTHNTHSKIVIKVELSTKNKIFSKIFSSRFTQEGVFAADINKISEQLNVQLSQLLNEIIQDSELNAKLQQL